MTFREIARKNLRFNIRKFASYFLVNIFVVCVLFLFGSLLFNEILMADPSVQEIRNILRAATAGMTVFSAVFLVYTGMYFIRSRGREFGIYLTLGMTHEDLSHMAAVEIGVIFAGAAVLGIGAGLLLINLFYMALARLLDMHISILHIGYQAFLFSLGALAGIFVVQRAMTFVFIKRLTVIKVLTANTTKDRARQRPIVGILSTLLFILSSVLLHGMVIGTASWPQRVPWLFDFFDRFRTESFFITFATFLVSGFFLIGSWIAGAAAACKLFPRLYNRYILLFSGLEHKLRTYRTSLFSITLLVAFAVFFLGAFMAMYLGIASDVDTFQPFDFTIERRAGFNHVSEDEIRSIVSNAGGEIEDMRVLTYVDARAFHEYIDGAEHFIGWYWEIFRTSFLASASGFGRFVGQEIYVAPGELIVITNGHLPERMANTTIAVTTPSRWTHDGATEWFNTIGMMSWRNVYQAFEYEEEMPPILRFSHENTQKVHMPFVNTPGVMTFWPSQAYIICDELFYSIVSQAEVYSIVAFELAYGNHVQVMHALISTLSELNGLPYGVWDSHNPANFSRLRPLSRAERSDLVFRAYGLVLFIVSMLGVVFLASSVMVLYHKFVADMDEEAVNIGLFKKIGLTDKECRHYIEAHLGIVFFLPLLLGGIPALFLVSQIDMFQRMPAYEMWWYFSRIVGMYMGILLFNTLMYFALRRRFFLHMGLIFKFTLCK